MSDAWAADRPGASRPANLAAFPGAIRSVDPAESARDKWVGPEPVNSAGELEHRGVAIPSLPGRLAEAETASRQGPAAAEQLDVPRAALPVLAVSHVAAEEPKESRVPAAASLVGLVVPLEHCRVRWPLELALLAEARQVEAVSGPKAPAPVSALREPAAAAPQPDGWACQA